MEEPWKILFYRTQQDTSPLKEFIDGLEVKTQTKIFNAIDFLRDFGIRAGSEHIKKVAGTQLWELRILGADSIRIFYIAVAGKTFLLLHGFKKKKMKTPPKEIKTALERLADHRARGV